MQAVTLLTRGVICEDTRAVSIVTWGFICIALVPIEFTPTFVVPTQMGGVKDLFNKEVIISPKIIPVIGPKKVPGIISPPQVNMFTKDPTMGAKPNADLYNKEANIVNKSVSDIGCKENPELLEDKEGDIYNKEDPDLYNKIDND